VIKLGKIDPPDGGKTEAILVIGENDSGSYEFMVVFDGVKNGSPMLFKFAQG
jgi:hypothetical protein